jgi:hypothetical protein
MFLPTNIRLGWKGLLGTNTPAYYENSLITSVKSGSGVNFSNIFIHNFFGRKTNNLPVFENQFHPTFSYKKCLQCMWHFLPNWQKKIAQLATLRISPFAF